MSPYDIYDDELYNSKAAAGSRSAANGSNAREGSGVEDKSERKKGSWGSRVDLFG